MKLTLCVGMSTIFYSAECETETNAVCWEFFGYIYINRSY